jgi:uncharacterized damage-inducible protein DinB
MTTKTKARRSPAVLDQLRAQALKGDRLDHLSDADREWIWRSLLKGVRFAEAVRLSGLSPEQVERALRRIRKLYQKRLDDYKASVVAEAQQPKVVRPVAPAQPVKQRGWLFGKRR